MRLSVLSINAAPVSAYDIHEWIYEKLRLQDNELTMIQIDGPRRQVYIKFSDPQKMQTLLSATQGQEDFRHDNGEISKVRIDVVGIGMRRVRVANLPPEVADKTLKMAISTYGGIQDIQPETWSNAYRYPVAHGIRMVTMILGRHIPSHLVLAGYRTLISYEGQPTTCYGCNEPGHLYTACPHRRRVRVEDRLAPATTWAAVAAKGPDRPSPTNRWRTRK
jgi:hypothetical protein